MTSCNEVEDDMKKLFAFFIFLLSTGLVAIDQKKDNRSTKQNDMYINRTTQSRTELLSQSRSISPCGTPESSDDESDESSIEESSSDEWKNVAPQSSLSVEAYLERFGGYLFGGAMVVLISYKFYSAGYL